MARQHGITGTTYKNFAIDSGAVYVDYGEGGQALLGATRGGNTFVLETEWREMPVDGARGPVLGSQRIVGVVAKLTANFVEIDDTVLEYALAGSTNTDNTTYKTLTRSLQVADADYATNIAIVGEHTGEPAVPIVCQVNNPLATGGFELAFTDKEETVLAVEFTAHFGVSDLDTEPWQIDWPVYIP